MTTTLTAYNFLNITPNELILFPTSLRFCLVYFKIYLKIFQTTFLYCFWNMCYLHIFENRILEEKKAFKRFGVHPTLPHHEGKHSEPRHNIFGVLVDSFITPYNSIMPGFRMLAFMVWRGGGALQNFWKLLSLPKILFSRICK